MGITADDFDCLQKTLTLWREKMVTPERKKCPKCGGEMIDDTMTFVCPVCELSTGVPNTKAS